MGDESDYLDFEISIQKSGTDSYLIRAESGNGQAESVFTIPFNEDKRALIDATLTKVALRSSAKVRSSSAPEVKKMREVGSTLFEQAITGQVREFYYKCQGQADQQGKGIRWRLSLDPSVGDLPWEFLHLQGDFLGNVEFDFQLVGSTQGPKSTRRTRGGDESLKAKADKRYQDAEEAMVRGEWAAAATAFRGALDFVPGYQDAAHKLSICESRDKAATLYNKAQRLCAEKQYYQALHLLAEISRLDPSLVDTANVLATAECGQKFHRAIGELQARNRDRGVELLREVINSQPDFEDAAQRLDNLASGGDGLFNDRVPPSLPTPPPPPPPPAEAFEWRLYSLANPDPKALAEEIRQYFLTTGHENQVLQQGNVSVVQGQKTGWRSWVGMGLAATVKIETTSNGIKVSVGGGKWLEQGAAIAVSMLVLWPLLITGGVGMAQQKQLIDA
ncbi:MAG: hypothetical protein ACR2G5_03405 [Pyrinomonadaceae bacterium]